MLRRRIVVFGVTCLALGTQSTETTTVRAQVQDSDGSPLVARISILKGHSAPGIEAHDTSSRGRSPLRLGPLASSPSPRRLAITDNQVRNEP